MCNYAKTNDNKIYVVFSDNVQDETMDLISIQQCDDYGKYDVESIYCEEFNYRDIVVTDNNIEIVKSYAK